jgi:hypothetical protein
VSVTANVPSGSSRRVAAGHPAVEVFELGANEPSGRRDAAPVARGGGDGRGGIALRSNGVYGDLAKKASSP